jgi:LPXTG-motif cell wall-anchored protein
MAIYLTRWLLTPFALPTTLIAGSSNYPWRNFTLFVILGQATWITLYGGVGYAFGSQWELVSEFVSNFTGLIVGLIILGVGVYLLFRRRKTH